MTTPNATRANGPAPVPRVTDTWLVIPLYNEATVVREVISQANLHHGADYTPWEGFAVTGWPVMTLARGAVVAVVSYSARSW